MTSFFNETSSTQSFPEMVGFIGASQIAAKHIKCLQAMAPSVKITVLSQHEEPRSDAEKGIIYTNSLDRFAEIAPSWVVITTAAANHHHHIDVICGFATAVLIEKPVAATSQQAQLIQNAQVLTGCPIVVGYNLRFLDAFNQLRQVLSSDILGCLYSVQVTVGQNLEAWRPERSVDTTVSVKRSMGGGVLRELSHELDLMQVLFGQPEYSTMMASSGKFIRFDVEDTAFILASYREDQSKPPFIASINMDFVRRDATRQMAFIGEKGTVNYDLIDGHVRFTDDNGTQTLCKISNDIIHSYQRMWEAFANKEFDRFCSVKNASDTLALIEKLEDENPLS